MRRVVFLMGLLGFVYGLGAQIIQPYEPAVLEVFYNKHVVLDTLDPDNRFRDETIMLRQGQRHAIWVSPKTVWADSLMTYNFNLYMQIHRELNPPGSAKNYKFMGGRETEYLFKNMPEGKNTVYRYFNLEHRIYEEEADTPRWDLLDSTKLILGYECHLARSQYRGREWLAWYSPEIALDSGPWKLGGLPGLILEAYDSKRHYVFTAQSLNDKELRDVGIFIYKKKFILKMTRDTYLREWYRFMNAKVSLADRIIQSGAFGIKPQPGVKPAKQVRDAYDLEETNYPHDLPD